MLFTPGKIELENFFFKEIFGDVIIGDTEVVFVEE